MGLKSIFFKPADGEGEPKSSPPTRTQTSAETPFRSTSSAPPPPTRTPLLKLDGVSAPASTAPRTTQTQRAQRTPDAQFLAILDKVLSGVTTQGYTELIGQMDVLREDIPDKDRLIRAAIKSVTRTLGIAPAQLVAAIEDRLRALEREKTETESQLADEAREKVASSKQAAEEANRRIGTIDSQIARLQQERAESERTAQSAQQAIESVHGEVSELKDRFTSAYNLRFEELTHMLADLRSSISA